MNSTQIDMYLVSNCHPWALSWALTFWCNIFPGGIIPTRLLYSIVVKLVLLFEEKRPKSVNGNDSLSFRGAILWNTLSDSIKSLATSASFKRSIKEWKGDNCSCKICRKRARGNFTRSVFVRNYLQIVISFFLFV